MPRIGRDDVHHEGVLRIVESAREMPDWKASRFRKTEILYQNVRYFVSEAGRGAGRRHRYVLEPWPAELADIPARSIVYDAEYVANRDGGRSQAWLGLLLWPLQLAVSPLLGCLWSRTKRRLEGPLALNAKTATSRSLFCEYLLALALGVLAWPLVIYPSFFPDLSPLATAATAVALLVDGAMRYDRMQNDPEDLLGVVEWLNRFHGHRTRPRASRQNW
jgi:hypothetical protein